MLADSGKIRTNLWRDWRAANVAGISDTGSHSVAKLSVKLSVQDAEFDIVCPIRSLLCILHGMRDGDHSKRRRLPRRSPLWLAWRLAAYNLSKKSRMTYVAPTIA